MNRQYSKEELQMAKKIKIKIKRFILTSHQRNASQNYTRFSSPVRMSDMKKTSSKC